MSKGSKRRPTDEQKYKDNWDAIFGKKNPTGWDNGLNQDYDKKLGRWFADRMDARQTVREVFKEK